MRLVVHQQAIASAAADVGGASRVLAIISLSDVTAAVVAALPGSMASHHVATALAELDNALASLTRELAEHATELHGAARHYVDAESTTTASLAGGASSAAAVP